MRYFSLLAICVFFCSGFICADYAHSESLGDRNVNELSNSMEVVNLNEGEQQALDEFYGRDRPNRDQPAGNFALISQRNPWGFDLERIFRAVDDLEYDRHRQASAFAELNLQQYDVIWIGNYQSDGWKRVYNENRERVEEYVDGGGVIYHCTGTNYWSVTPVHPGGLQHRQRSYEWNGISVVSQEENELMDRMDWDEGTEFYGTYYCHATYPEDRFDDIENSGEYEVLVVGEQTEEPVVARYSYGGGQVVVSGATDGYLHYRPERYNWGRCGEAMLYYLAGLAAEREGWITGTIVNSRNGEPLDEGYAILSNGETAQAGEEGVYWFSEVPAGNYTIIAHAPEFNQLESEEFEVVSAETTAVDFELELGVLLEVALIAPNGGERFGANQEVTIEWEYQNRHNLEMIILEGSTDGGEFWGPIDTLRNEATEHTVTTPEAYSDQVLVRVALIDEEGNIAFDVSDDMFTIAPEAMESQFVPGWSLISFPLEPADPDPEAVIGDDLGGGIWSIYNFDNQQGFQEPDELHSGPGFWFAIAHDTITVDVEGSANFNRITGTVGLGWNLIGCPFPVGISIFDLQFRLEGEDYTAHEAVDDGFFLPVLYGHRPYIGYLESNVLTPWHGYWFLCLVEEMEVIFDPPDPRDLGGDPGRDGTADIWELRIVTEFGNAVDEITTLGISPAATDGFDPVFDFPEPPPTPDETYVKSYFIHQDWLQMISDQFNRDIRAEFDEGEERWAMTVETDNAGEVRLSWVDIEVNPLPESYDFFLIDAANGAMVNMRENLEYTFETEGGNYTIIFQISASQDVETEEHFIPQEYSIGAYPNPFNSAARISYAIPHSQELEVVIIDINGEFVAELSSGYVNAGVHNLTWDATQIPAGLYFVQLKAESAVLTKKIVLTK